MNDPVAGLLLADAFLHQRLLAAEQLHGQLIVRRLEQGLQLIFDEALLATLTCGTCGGATRVAAGAHRRRHVGAAATHAAPAAAVAVAAAATRGPIVVAHRSDRAQLLLWRSVQTQVVAAAASAKVHLSATATTHSPAPTGTTATTSTREINATTAATIIQHRAAAKRRVIVVRQEIAEQKRFVIDRRHQTVSACVRVLQTNFDGVAIDAAAAVAADAVAAADAAATTSTATAGRASRAATAASTAAAAEIAVGGEREAAQPQPLQFLDRVRATVPPAVRGAAVRLRRRLDVGANASTASIF